MDGWGKRGSDRRVLFKLECMPYGYTLVGKGTLTGRLWRLQHEGHVYAQLERKKHEGNELENDDTRKRRGILDNRLQSA